MKFTRPILPVLRRYLAIPLTALGAVLILFAPETWAGVLLLVAGLAIELISLVLQHTEPR